VKLPHKRSHVVVFKIERQHFVGKFSRTFDMKAFSIASPAHQVRDIQILHRKGGTDSMSLSFFMKSGNLGIFLSLLL
jgi:hypothetical protein